MTYDRPRLAPVVVGVVLALALLLALWCAVRATITAIRTDERAAVLRAGEAILTQSLVTLRAVAHERDALRAVVRQRDTVLVTRLRTVRDTAWVPVDTTPVVRDAACRAQLDTLASDCDAFRVSATAALASADTMRRRDSTVRSGLSVQLAGVRRADSTKAARLASRATWRTVERALCATSVVSNVLQWRVTR